LQRGIRRRAKALTRLGGLLHAFQNAAKRAKLPDGLRPYDLRHTRLTRWAATKPLPLVQKAAGHASIRTTMGYVHLGDDDLSVLVEQPPARKQNEKTG
jgi:integrase